MDASATQRTGAHTVRAISRLGVTYVTVSLRETGLAKPNHLARKALMAFARNADNHHGNGAATIYEGRAGGQIIGGPLITDFRADPENVRLFVECERLRYANSFCLVCDSETSLY